MTQSGMRLAHTLLVDASENGSFDVLIVTQIGFNGLA